MNLLNLVWRIVSSKELVSKMLAGGSGKKFQKTQKTRLKDFRDRENDDRFQVKKKKHDKSLLRMLRQDKKDSSY